MRRAEEETPKDTCQGRYPEGDRSRQTCQGRYAEGPKDFASCPTIPDPVHELEVSQLKADDPNNPAHGVHPNNPAHGGHHNNPAHGDGHHNNPAHGGQHNCHYLLLRQENTYSSLPHLAPNLAANCVQFSGLL